jgi:CRP/FNR family cyclic AMP-dependent transcriptional regulator
MENLERILGDHPFFHNLDETHLAVLVGCATNARFSAGDYIFREGGDADAFYLIRHGKVALEMHTPTGGGKLTIATLDEGDVLGWSWLVPPYRWRFDAKAIGPVTAIGLDGKCLRGKCEDDHNLGYELTKRFAAIITERLQATRLQLLDVYAANA